jgi:flagellar biosynthetic protein FliO
MTVRLLTILALALPLAACAAQPGPGQAVEPAAAAPAAATTAAAQDTQAATPASAPGVTEPAAAPARQAAPPSAAAATTHPRAAADAKTANGVRATAADTAIPQTPAVQPETSAAPAGTAAPDVATPRAATPGAAVPPVAMPAGSSTGSLLQTLFALILVLAVLGALAWFLKRYGPKVAGGNANLRVVGSLNLGGRERIVVVEVGNEWIVVGASPGRINALATMPRQDGQDGDASAANATLARPANGAPVAHSFAEWLKQTIDKRK